MPEVVVEEIPENEVIDIPTEPSDSSESGSPENEVENEANSTLGTDNSNVPTDNLLPDSLENGETVTDGTNPEEPKTPESNEGASAEPLDYTESIKSMISQIDELNKTCTSIDKTYSEHLKAQDTAMHNIQVITTAINVGSFIIAGLISALILAVFYSKHR